jgi:hypothetical protein
LVATQNLLNGGRRKRAVMQALQFMLNPSRSEISLVAQCEDPLLLLFEHFLTRDGIRTMTLSHKTFQPLLLKASNPQP